MLQFPICIGIIFITWYKFQPYIFKSITVEDFYQHERNKKNKTTQSVIDTVTVYNDKMVDYELIRSRLQKFNKNLEEIHKTEVPVNAFETLEEFNNCTVYFYKMYYCREKNTIYAKLNHEYIGGSNLAKITYTIYENEQVSNFKNSSFLHLFHAIKLWLNKHNLPIVKNPLPLYENKNQIRRYTTKYNFERNGNVKATIIHKTLKEVHESLKLDRELVCYLPIAFESTSSVCNNIGLMWLTYSPSDTVETIKQQMENNLYQIPGLNFLLNNGLLRSSSGSNARKNVDAVLTIIFANEDQDIDSYWTYSNVAEYPVYIAIYSRLSENCVNITQTITVNTPNFETKEELKSKEFFGL